MKSTLHYLKLKAVLILILFSSAVFSQQGINYQGVARDVNSDLLVDAKIILDINIIKTTAKGSPVYSETHNLITDINGVFSIVIGNGMPTLNFYEDIDWAEDKHYLNVFLNGAEVGTTEFVSVPYASALGKWQAHKNGVTPKGTGGSIYIGENAGENDDFMDNHNIGFGLNALRRNSTGLNNIAMGYEALKFNSDGNWNTAMGYKVLYNNSSGNENIGIGFEALLNNTSGVRNTAFGYEALHSNTTGTNNFAAGYKALYSNTQGNSNIALGELAMRNNTMGLSNIAIGSSALSSNTEGDDNLALGRFSMISNTTGNNNIALGLESLQANTTGNYNVASGFHVMLNNTTGSYNVASGYRSLYKNKTGSYNIALGLNALYNNFLGDRNIALGKEALFSNVTGPANIAIGYESQYKNVSGHSNIGIGARTLQNNTDSEENVAIGYAAGFSALGRSNVFIGNQAGYNEIGSNKLYINNSNGSFPLIYGDFNTDILSFNAKVGIGTKAPAIPLQITTGIDATLGNGTGQILLGSESLSNLVLDANEIQARNNGAASTLYLQQGGGNVNVGGAVVHASDRRLKRNIKDISYGLKDVLKLEPKEYFWKGKTQDYKSLGLIAQDVDEVIKNVVTYDKEIDRYGVSYTELIPVLIKAIQQQQEIIEAQEARYLAQNKIMLSLETRLEKMEHITIAINQNE